MAFLPSNLTCLCQAEGRMLCPFAQSRPKKARWKAGFLIKASYVIQCNPMDPTIGSIGTLVVMEKGNAQGSDLS